MKLSNLLGLFRLGTPRSSAVFAPSITATTITQTSGVFAQIAERKPVKVADLIATFNGEGFKHKKLSGGGLVINFSRARYVEEENWKGKKVQRAVKSFSAELQVSAHDLIKQQETIYTPANNPGKYKMCRRMAEAISKAILELG